MMWVDGCSCLVYELCCMFLWTGVTETTFSLHGKSMILYKKQHLNPIFETFRRRCHCVWIDRFTGAHLDLFSSHFNVCLLHASCRSGPSSRQTLQSADTSSGFQSDIHWYTLSAHSLYLRLSVHLPALLFKRLFWCNRLHFHGLFALLL